MKNGIVLIGGFGSDGVARRVFDMQIMNQWPIIPLPKTINQIHRDWSGNNHGQKIHDHLSIPPDLELHFSPSHDKVTENLVDLNGELKKDLMHLVSWSSQPISNYPKLGNMQKEGGSALLFLMADSKFTSKTGIFVDIFAHRSLAQIQDVISAPFQNETMRYSLPSDRSVLPMWYKDILRHKNPRVDPKFFLTLRFGLWECEDENAIFAIPVQ
jgi:hypothetical protein